MAKATKEASEATLEQESAEKTQVQPVDLSEMSEKGVTASTSQRA